MPLRADCAGVVPPALLPLVPARFDVIGDIALVQLSSPLLPYAGAIAQAIISRRKNIRSVARKVTMVAGERRTASFDLIAGAGTETVHREYGFAYRLDIAEAFFAPRLASERRRVAGLVEPGERVLVPFAGVGPFAVPPAAAGAEVTAIEQNPAAFRYLVENAKANGVAGRMRLICDDAFDPSVVTGGPYDRAVVPAPYGQDSALEILAPTVRTGGTIHFYTFKKRHEIPALKEKYEADGFTVLSHRRCGNVAPGVSRWAFDLTRAET
jgi:tRNA (guanine37-N1)-methyltransferase